MALLFALIGAFFRRYWGGWLDAPPSPYKGILKRALGYVLSFAAALYATRDPVSASVMALILGTGWMAPIPPGHAYGTWMMNWDDNRVPPRHHTILTDCLALAQCYLIMTVPAGLVWFFIDHDPLALLYCPVGALAPLCYLVPKLIWYKVLKLPYSVSSKPAAFIDGVTCIGELLLGVIIYLPLGL